MTDVLLLSMTPNTSSSSDDTPSKASRRKQLKPSRSNARQRGTPTKDDKLEPEPRHFVFTNGDAAAEPVEDSLTCVYCSETLPHYDALKEHIDQLHLNGAAPADDETALDLCKAPRDADDGSPNAPLKKIFHADAYCHICQKEFCNKYFLKTHLANKHGIFDNAAAPATPATPAALPVAAPSLPVAKEDKAEARLDMPSFPDMLEDYCDICQKHFCNKYYLKKHRADVHGVANELKSKKPSNGEKGLAAFFPANNAAAMPQLAAMPAQMPGFMLLNPYMGPMMPSLLAKTPHEPFVTVKDKEDAKDADEAKDAVACPLCKKEFCSDFFLKTHLIAVHGKPDDALFLTPMEALLQPRLPLDQATASMMDSYMAAKMADRVICEICNKQVCNKYFLKTHKWKIHGIPPENDSPTLYADSPDAKAELKADSRPEARPDAKSEVKSEVKMDARMDARMEARMEARVEARVEARTDPRMDPRLDPRMDPRMDGRLDARTDLRAELRAELERCAEEYEKSNSPPRTMFEQMLEDERRREMDPAKKAELISMGIDPEAYCDLCKKEFCSKYFLRTHQLNIHGIKRSGPPAKRGRPSLSQLTEARGKSLPQTHIRVFCQICNKELCNKYFLKSHMLNTHGIQMDDAAANLAVLAAKEARGDLLRSEPVRDEDNASRGMTAAGDGAASPRRFQFSESDDDTNHTDDDAGKFRCSKCHMSFDAMDKCSEHVRTAHQDVISHLKRKLHDKCDREMQQLLLEPVEPGLLGAGLVYLPVKARLAAPMVVTVKLTPTDK